MSDIPTIEKSRERFMNSSLFHPDLLAAHEPNQMFVSCRFLRPIPRGLRPKARGCRLSEDTLGTRVHDPVNPTGVVSSPRSKPFQISRGSRKVSKYRGEQNFAALSSSLFRWKSGWQTALAKKRGRAKCIGLVLNTSGFLHGTPLATKETSDANDK
jgi:hypothetical protein